MFRGKTGWGGLVLFLFRLLCGGRMNVVRLNRSLATVGRERGGGGEGRNVFGNNSSSMWVERASEHSTCQVTYLLLHETTYEKGVWIQKPNPIDSICPVPSKK